MEPLVVKLVYASLCAKSLYHLLPKLRTGDNFMRETWYYYYNYDYNYDYCYYFYCLAKVAEKCKQSHCMDKDIDNSSQETPTPSLLQ